MAKIPCKGFLDSNNWNVLNVTGNRIPYSKLPENLSRFQSTVNHIPVTFHSQIGKTWPAFQISLLASNWKTLVLQSLRTSCNTRGINNGGLGFGTWDKVCSFLCTKRLEYQCPLSMNCTMVSLPTELAGQQMEKCWISHLHFKFLSWKS